jgi:hypothetical protein
MDTASAENVAKISFRKRLFEFYGDLF